MEDDPKEADSLSDLEQQREKMLKQFRDNGPVWIPRPFRGDRDTRPKRRRVDKRFGRTLTTRAMLMAIEARDHIPSDPVFLELLIEAYLEKYREPPIVIPSEEELIRMFEKKRDDDDAE